MAMIAGLGIIVCPIVFIIGNNLGFDNGRDVTAKFFSKKESAEQLIMLAYEAKYKWCKKENISMDVCDGILIHHFSSHHYDPGDTLDDENTFIFANTFRSSNNTIVYEVTLANDGKFLSESKPAAADVLDDYPVER